MVVLLVGIFSTIHLYTWMLFVFQQKVGELVGHAIIGNIWIHQTWMLLRVNVKMFCTFLTGLLLKYDFIQNICTSWQFVGDNISKLNIAYHILCLWIYWILNVIVWNIVSIFHKIDIVKHFLSLVWSNVECTFCILTLVQYVQ